ncbi:MAG: hypothetical protein WBA07_22655 [Rivularia sp. (in: cyanobacteria)]
MAFSLDARFTQLLYRKEGRIDFLRILAKKIKPISIKVKKLTLESYFLYVDMFSISKDI